MFITLTTNPKWDEIQDELLCNQSPFDRVDIVCQVFKARLDAFLHNLKNGKYFENHKVNYILRVIEYQHRGMPHAHIVVQLDNIPKDENIQECIQWIDNHISAQLPNENETKYYKLIKEHMTHKCSHSEANGCKKDKNSKCKRGYDVNALNHETKFDEKGFPKYKRLKNEDLLIVLHNKEILLDWEGHCNVEWAASSRQVSEFAKKKK